MEPYSDKEILTQINAGDPMKIVDILYAVEYPKIKNYILSNNGQETDAEDIFQESLYTLIRYVKLGKFDTNYSIGGFMFAIARNSWRKQNRSARVFTEIQDYHQVEEEEYETEAPVDKVAVIKELIENIGKNCKEILTNILFYRMTLAEVADKMGYDNSGVVKTRHYKCKKRLIKMIEDNTGLLNILKS